MFLFLLPPSEWKKEWWIVADSLREFRFPLPVDIASLATQKDLKCVGKRYQEWISLNSNINYSLLLPAIQRYSGVMFKSIAYDSMSHASQEFFDNHTLILSGMYWLVKPKELIWNYKLPIDTKWLRQRWWDILTDSLIQKYEWETVVFIDLLSWAYQKLLNEKKLRAAWFKYLTISFYKKEGNKYTHWVKKVKGERLRQICDQRNMKFNPDHSSFVKIVV